MNCKKNLQIKKPSFIFQNEAGGESYAVHSEGPKKNPYERTRSDLDDLRGSIDQERDPLERDSITVTDGSEEQVIEKFMDKHGVSRADIEKNFIVIFDKLGEGAIVRGIFRKLENEEKGLLNAEMTMDRPFRFFPEKGRSDEDKAFDRFAAETGVPQDKLKELYRAIVSRENETVKATFEKIK